MEEEEGGNRGHGGKRKRMRGEYGGAMRYVRWAIGISSVLVCASLAARGFSVEQSEAAKATPLILAANDGERREFRTRPGVTFTVKVDPKNGGSEHMAVVTEDMAPGDRIPVHRHPRADELIFIQGGTGRVTLGDKVQEVHAGGIVFIPSDTWIGMGNIGKDHLTHVDIWSVHGFEEYMRVISVPAGSPVTPLSKAELEELRRKYSHDGVFQ
jgi:quercetin dioxygenase-like cupin family protein